MNRKLKRWVDSHDFITGVPCSKFKGIINYDKVIIATKEDEALAMAIGAKLMDKNPLVFMQDSGLGSCLTLLTSIMQYYDIEIDLLISLRKKPEYHRHMSKITPKLLNLLNYKNIKYVKQNG